MSRKKVDRFVVLREKEAALHLSPGLFPAGTAEEWTAENRTLIFSTHPLNNGCALAVAGKKTREHLAEDNRVFEQDEKVYVCRMETVPDERLPFIYDSHAVFVSLQKMMRTIEESEDTDAAGHANGTTTSGERTAADITSLLQTSALYREAMLRQVRVLQEAPRETEFILSEMDVFQAMHAVWHLVEIIYLATNMPGGLSAPIVPHFMGWLNFNFPAPLAEDGQRIFADGPSADDLAANPDVWPYLKKLALRGHVTTMANMLDRIAPAKSSVSASVARWAREVARIARAMPLGSDEETAGSFNARWRLWNGELQSTATAIRSLLASPSPSPSPSTKEEAEAEATAATSAGAGSDDPALESLYSIVEAMRGDAAAISAQSETWQDMMGATLLYSEPTAQADRLPTLAAEVADEFQTHEFAILDRTLVALLRHELPEFLVYSNQIDPWLSAHMSDMMEHINILGVCRRVFAVEPREHYVIELGEVYMSHEDLWRVGLEYLGMSGGCAGAGAAVMEEYAMRIPLESDRKAAQVLRTCAAHGLQRAADRIHRQLGRQKWQQGRLGAAITHFAQARDHRSVGLVCDQLWAAYLESGGSGDLAYGPTIDGVLAATGVRHDRLDFLSRYRDFHACYGAGDPVAAGRILLAIITAGIAPPHAVRDLLVDAIPLLEGDALVFSADDTFELLRRAEEEKRDGTNGNSSSSEMSVFSVACARNLARAFVAA